MYVLRECSLFMVWGEWRSNRRGRGKNVWYLFLGIHQSLRSNCVCGGGGGGGGGGGSYEILVLAMF